MMIIGTGQNIMPKLVRRDEFYLDLNCVKNWSWELREMNRKKTGAPYKYHDSFMTLHQ
jgi:hypothetical protein